MKSDTSFKVFFLKQYRKNSLKTIVFPWESVFMAIAIWLLGHRITQNAHCARVIIFTIFLQKNCKTIKTNLRQAIVFARLAYRTHCLRTYWGWGWCEVWWSFNRSKNLVRFSPSRTVGREVHGKCVGPSQRGVLVPPLTDNLVTRST